MKFGRVTDNDFFFYSLVSARTSFCAFLLVSFALLPLLESQFIFHLEFLEIKLTPSDIYCIGQSI